MEQLNIAMVTVGRLILVLGCSRPGSGAASSRAARRPPRRRSARRPGTRPSRPGRLGQAETILEQAARDARHQADGTGAEPVQRGPIRRWRSLAAMLGLVMPLMWLASGLLLYLIIGLQFWVAMLTGAVMTPTDPIVSSAIVMSSVAKENLPDVDRHTLSAESGANYGLAYPFVRLL